MTDFINDLKRKVVDTLNLTDVNPESIEEDAPLFGDGLGLDSIDVLELVVMLERDYGVKIETKELGQKVFYSIRSMAEYVEKSRSGKSP